jgi:hypothetical protein
MATKLAMFGKNEKTSYPWSLVQSFLNFIPIIRNILSSQFNAVYGIPGKAG